ncbi:MAG: glycoside hydrolase family 78 protein [Fimbriimonadaceae bacterium]|nr:glycoside hydrolase family 78 protein [Fimbriimonadaceae bacterium]
MGVDTSQPRLSWVLKGSPEQKDQRQSAYRIVVTSRRGTLWDSGKVLSSDQNNVEYAGKALMSGEVCTWKVRVWDGAGRAQWCRPSLWEMGLLRPLDWVGQWINDGKETANADAEMYLDDPAPLFRKEFATRSRIVRARLYITGLGYYEAWLNGSRIGDHVLDPGWTDVDKRVYYSVFDVTKMLKSGKNCLGVMLGNGWFNPLPLRLFGSFNLRQQLTIGRPRLIAQMRIEYRDGTSEIIATDRSWKVSEGPILRNNIYLGEVYDARKEQHGWDKPGFGDTAWRRPALAKEKLGRLVAQPLPPIRVTAKWNAVKVTEPKPGVLIYDCGVNFAGWVSLKLNIPAGTEVRIRYGELLHPDGSLNPMTSVAGQIKGKGTGGPGAPDIAWQSDTYIARGGSETYTPRFTFHGFRYVEITGLPAPLPLSSVTAMRLNSDVKNAGAFECSNPMLNQIQAMCRRTFLSNIFSVQSDCPHRERLGYGGDIVATSEAFMTNFDMANFYAKTVSDWSDSAFPDGMFTDTAPFIGIQYCGVIWAMAHPLLVDQLHQYYGDRRITVEEYMAAKKWIELVHKKYPSGIVNDGLSDHEGLAPAPSPDMVTPLYFQCLKLLAAQARRLSRKADEDRFLELAETVRKAYLAQFFDPLTGKVGPGTQASQAIALYTDIVPFSARRRVLDYLLDDIRAKKDHLTTGILGTKFMLDVLSQEGYPGVAYAIATQSNFPGWGWMLKNGATTLWEHWEFSDNTFSHNHPMFGSISQWMMQWLGGIRPVAGTTGLAEIVIQPQTPKGLDWVKSSQDTIRGRIISNWSRQGTRLRYEVTIPINTRARAILPEDATEMRALVRPRRVGKNSVFDLGSGSYVFSADRP